MVAVEVPGELSNRQYSQSGTPIQPSQGQAYSLEAHLVVVDSQELAEQLSAKEGVERTWAGLAVY